MKNIYSYTKTEINKMTRDELLKLKYEREKDYFESTNGSKKNWSIENPFEKWAKGYERFTVRDLRDELK